jgi:hypothetical protein
MNTTNSVHGDRFFQLLAILLVGYALIGKSFAYVGVGPVFVGEMVLAFGVAALLMTENWSRVLRTAWVLPLAAFMAWGARCTVPYIGRYGVDSLRDAAIWGWGVFAIVIASLIAAEPRRMAQIDRFFAWFGKWFLLLAPLAYLATHIAAVQPIKAPWAADVPIISVKGGDQVVHLTGIFAYAVLLGDLGPALVIFGAMANLAVSFTGRAAMVTFGLGAAILAIVRPKSKILWALVPTMACGLFLMWVLNIHVATDGENQREISAEQVVQNVTSIFTDSDNQNLAGSKEWRLKWWDEILRYTIHGPYFWSGKGFGVNLADDDGFQVQSDGSLRSPHNGHLTMLARMGVPGLALWIVLQGSWAIGIGWNYLAARRRGEQRWAGLFMTMLVYWCAFMANASFDVFLEGPVGGIWMWSLFGVGLGAMWVFRNAPEALVPDSTNAFVAGREPNAVEPVLA